MNPDETAPHTLNPTPEVLAPGTVLAGRFQIERLAGRGGMGAVYQALDGASGQRVALKLLHGNASPEGVHRFHREASVLERLRHPGIVSHVAHGTSAQGQSFLAMEWLEGEELSRRLVRAPLTLWELLALLRRAAEALAHAHREGIVHRDLKPSNLLLRGGRPEDVVLLDFGLARQSLVSHSGVTGSHAVVGTPGYMAPEQASSHQEIPPAADIFSLGCVLYECLTGKPPFAAPHFAAVLAKILFAEPAPLPSIRPGLPASLVALVEHMLVKDPARRLPDADALRRALDALEPMPEALPPRVEPPPESLTLEGAPQQLVSVLLVSARTRPRLDETADWTQDVALRDSLRVSLVPYGAQVELLADGSLVATLMPERGTATDQAALAARCALTFKERWPESEVVLVTGMGVLNERLPVGDAMDRAGGLLKRMGRESVSGQVVLDEVTAGLLGPGFLLTRREADVFLLRGERLSADESRPLLGKPTPCVGREQELALLEFAFNGCVEEPAARAVLVTAPPGTGKSRLRHEFLRRLGRRESPPLVLMGRAEPLGMGATSGMLGQALRELCGVVDGQEPREQRERLRQGLSPHLPAGGQGTVAFLGELCSIPFADEDEPLLRSARRDPRLMSTQVGRALTAFLAAECEHQPVVLVLEDLHWSDALTVKRVEDVLRDLAERPLLVLALARPEVKTLFPQLWTRQVQEVALRGLSRKAGVRLVHAVLGEQMPAGFAQRLVELSDGNALFLEELIRLAAEGRAGETPQTVLAVIRARLTRMESGTRQVLLAASIFGRSFWPGGVGALLQPPVSGETLARHLRVLVEQELIEQRPDSHLVAESEYRFRHALVRDAAYGLVAEGYLPLGHRLAGAWLEQWSEVDPRVLATHHQLGGQPERALHFYTVAAEQLFDRHDLPGTLRCVEAALACGVEGGDVVRLNALRAVMAFWTDDIPSFLSLADSVFERLEVGSRLWCWLMGGRILSGVYFRGMTAREVAQQGQVLRRLTPEPGAQGAYTWAVACLGLAFVYAGARWELEEWLGWMKEKEAAADRVERAWTRYMGAYFHHLFTDQPWRALQLAEEGTRDFRELGMERDALIVQTCAGVTLAGLGDIEGAVERLREVIVAGLRMEAQLTAGAAQHFLAHVLVNSPVPRHREEAHLLVRDWVVEGGPAYSFRQGIGHAVLGKVKLEQGALAEAEVHARQACALLAVHRADILSARALLSTVLLARGQALEAREVARLGVRELEELACQGAYAVGVRLTLAEACLALGEVAEGEAALREAVRCVRARAHDVPEPLQRERFLREVPSNARALALARERWGEDYLTGK